MNVRRDRGVANALGLVLIAPASIGLALLVVTLGRAVDTDAQLRTAAEAAAQAAALERDVSSAGAAAQRLVDDMFADDSICKPDRPRADTSYANDSGVSVDAGAMSGGVVTVIVGCPGSGGGDGELSGPVVAHATVDRFRSGG